MWDMGDKDPCPVTGPVPWEVWAVLALLSLVPIYGICRAVEYLGGEVGWW